MKISKQKIEILMAKQNLKVIDIAKRSGISRQSFSTIKNRGTCTSTTAAKICKGLGCEIDEITPTESED
ncbi:MAG: helix-turn-helix domain-containing protein [Oscillospiraceae bacterium]